MDSVEYSVEGSLDALEKGGEKRSLLASGVSISSRASTSSIRSPGVEKCYFWTTVTCSVSFLLLGIPAVVLGAVATTWHTSGSAYVGGGTAELILGTCLTLRVVFQCLNCLPRRRNAGNTTSCVLFAILAFVFLMWCCVICSFCTALALSAYNYSREKSEDVAIAIASVSLVLGFMFGVSVCCWAGCPPDWYNSSPSLFPPIFVKSMFVHYIYWDSVAQTLHINYHKSIWLFSYRITYICYVYT